MGVKREPTEDEKRREAVADLLLGVALALGVGKVLLAEHLAERKAERAERLAELRRLREAVEDCDCGCGGGPSLRQMR
jgi:hypothetical protein